MDEFDGLLARDFGVRQQGRSSPMSASRTPTLGSGSGSRSATSSNLLSSLDEVFGDPPRFTNLNSAAPAPSLDSIFDGFGREPSPPKPRSRFSSEPLYDTPLYDDDSLFDGRPAAKAEYDDLLGSLGRSSSARAESPSKDDLSGFEELIPGFGGNNQPNRREASESNQQKSAAPASKTSATMTENPFVVLEETTPVSAYSPPGMFTDPLEDLGKPVNSGSANVGASGSRAIFDNIDAFDGFAKTVPSFTSEKNESQKEENPFKSFDNVIPTTQPPEFYDPVSSAQSPSSDDSFYEKHTTADQPSKSSEQFEKAEDVWLTVDEIPLFTQTTSAPPPSRTPPAKPTFNGRADLRRKDNEYYSQSSPNYQYPKSSVRRSGLPHIDGLEDFAMNKPQTNEHTDVFSSEDGIKTISVAAASAAAMKEAMDIAEAKFMHAKEVKQREQDARSSGRDFIQERDEETASDASDPEDVQEKLERERMQRENEEKVREQGRLRKEREEREKARQAVERATREARERAAAASRAKAERAAVDKVNAEARQRAERAAVQRASAEARERAAAEARQKAEREATEARERAAAETRQKAARERATRERADTEARERAAVGRATAEARLRAERAAVDRAQAEVQGRAAAAARENLSKTENDLESFFGMGTRPNSTPKRRTTTTDNLFDPQTPSRGTAETRRTSSTSSTFRNTSSTTNIVDDLTFIFGGAPSSEEFQEIAGESAQRRRARLERHQRTLERAARALAEKNERDMQTQREQEEKHRIAERLDSEIKRWASGKEGNLRALLSTLQYVLWPDSGWQPVSLTDLITAAAVKKGYRKANLCVHPDKVQQRGADLQQKYIAEKVFDLLMEAWNKFNAEELF